MSNGIYGYYDTKNQYVVYIGQDVHIDKEKRHKEHLRPSCYDRQHINRVLQNNPDRYVYFKFVEGNYSQHEIDDFEKEAIKLLKTYKYDYPERSVFNFTPGGDFAPMRVPEIAKKMSGENSPMYGKKHSAETRKKISEARKGENHPMYGKTGKNNPRYGKKHSAETRKKMGEAHKGKKHSQETRKKMSEAHKGENHPMYGKHHSKETKQKMSEVKNTSGYYRVHKKRDNNCKQGFTWKYQYTENGKRKYISSVDLNKLEKKVINKGLEWRKFKK